MYSIDHNITLGKPQQESGLIIFIWQLALHLVLHFDQIPLHCCYKIFASPITSDNEVFPKRCGPQTRGDTALPTDTVEQRWHKQGCKVKGEEVGDTTPTFNEIKLELRSNRKSLGALRWEHLSK
jgi:hypothetical protein